MKPCTFDYFLADSVDHACALLAEHGDAARLIAGGQSLIPMMNLRLARPAILVDIGRLPLNTISVGDGVVSVGALTRHCSLIENAELRSIAPIFAETAHNISHPTIRRRGTSGGSVAHADPTAEIPALLTLLDGHVDAVSTSGKRQVAAKDLFRGAFSTSLKPAEMISALHYRLPKGPWGAAFIELAERSGDFAISAVGAVIERKGEDVEAARIVLLGADSLPVRAETIEKSLIGKRLSEQSADEAGKAVAGAYKCYGDIRASAEYRRHLLGEFTRRALLSAYDRAGTSR
ncbi:MAG: FAD binding domain-containing protein [Pseudolabrys sp.]